MRSSDLRSALLGANGSLSEDWRRSEAVCPPLPTLPYALVKTKPSTPLILPACPGELMSRLVEHRGCFLLQLRSRCEGDSVLGGCAVGVVC